MASKTTRLLVLLILAHMSFASEQVKLFINQLPGYSSLADCAVFQVSTIVRNMEDGCGDGSKTASYNCFCHTSSSCFSSFIGSKVEKACATDNRDFQKSSAAKLFDSYCHLGDNLTSLTSATSSLVSSTSSAESSSMTISMSISASPASTPHKASASASPNPPSSSTKESSSPPSSSTAATTKDIQSPKETDTTAIAVGVSVGIGLIAASIVAFLIIRCKRRQSPQAPATTDNSINGDDRGPMQELHGVERIAPLEIGGRAVVYKMHQELP